MDNTIADLDAALQVECGQRFPGLVLPAKTTFDFEEPWFHAIAGHLMTRKGFFLNLAPIPGAVDAIKEMALSHRVFFVTSPLSQYKYCVPEKYEWIEKHFGVAWTKRLVITKDKTLVQGDYLIDDKPTQEGAMMPPQWEHVYFTQPYNAQLTTKRHLRNWSDWRSIVETDSSNAVVHKESQDHQVSV
jgi:5'-nucleotidase